MNPEQLTVKEALEQGYTGFSRSNDERHFKLTDIPDMDDFSGHEWFLDSKEPMYLSVDPDDIYNDLVECFAVNNEVEDDGELGELIVEAYDWQLVADAINEKLKTKGYYFPTKIKLIL